MPLYKDGFTLRIFLNVALKDMAGLKRLVFERSVSDHQAGQSEKELRVVLEIAVETWEAHSRGAEGA